MKSVIKRWVVLITAIVMIFSVIAIAACTNPSNSSDYTVKVIGVDGLPYAGVRIQPCKVEANGELGMCYPVFIPTDGNGVASLTAGKDFNDPAGVDEIEIHLDGLPVYLTYTAPRMHKGETVTIELKEKIDTPLSGTGTGNYDIDNITGEVSDKIDLSSFDPYVVVEKGSYRLRFTSATQKIYFEFRTDYKAVYKVSSAGKIDVSVTQILGTRMTGLRNPGDAKYGNDNVSATDKNFSYEFEVSPSLIEQERGMGKCYFEVALENAGDINKDAIIYFEYVDEWEEKKGPATVDVLPEKTLSDFQDMSGKFVYADLSGDFKYEMGTDGYYHVGDKNGPILCASLGMDSDLNERHDGYGNAPRALDKGFTLQYKSGASLTVSDGKTYSYNYYPLVEAYTKASNKDGRYGLTEELKNFLDAYINQMGGTKSWVEDRLAEEYGYLPLPEGEEWLWNCGYYDENDIDAELGTEGNPKDLHIGDNEITLSAGEKVWYAFASRINAKHVIASQSTNVKLTWYALGDKSNATEVTSDENGLTLTIGAEAYQLYYFEFSSKDGEAATYTVNIDIPAEEGSSENPIVINELGTVDGENREGSSGAEEVYYTYTVTSDTTLYFSVGANTTIIVSWVGENEVPIERTLAEIADGLEIAAGVKLTIRVNTADGSVGAVQFTISDKAD